MPIDDLQQLLKKYDRPGPRYTSYPTAPVWRDDFGASEFTNKLESLGQSFQAGDARPLSLYYHIPFCEERCLFCGCNVVISRKRHVAEPYLKYLEGELDLFVQQVGSGRRTIQMHLGGGTPTYFSPEQLRRLMEMTRERFALTEDAEISIEVDPCVTTREHLETLRDVGFNRISMGLQDLDPLVQETVHRVQPEDLTDQFYRWCRELEFLSVNIDLIYGLPHQTVETFTKTIKRVAQWRPDRMAVFNYAHVPWIKKHQKLLPEDKLPDPSTKIAILQLMREYFVGEGYEAIGLDHFALPDDELSIARRAENLRRNFMGYTTLPETDILAFGVSSISEVDGVYAQNETKLASYYRALDAGGLSTIRGVVLTDDDKLRRDVIMGIMNNLALDYSKMEARHGIVFADHFEHELAELEEHQSDGLVRLLPGRLEVTDRGSMLVRNVAMVFDAYLKMPEDEAGSPRFSRTV